MHDWEKTLIGETCEFCHFFNDVGECWRFPPSRASDFLGESTGRPKPRKKDYCGEWKPKETK